MGLAAPHSVSMTGYSAENSRRSVFASLAPCLLCVAGFLPFLIQPGIVEGLVHYLGLDTRTAGTVASLEMGALVLGSVLVPILTQKHAWRTIVLGALSLMVIGDLATFGYTGVVKLGLARAIAGVGEGILIATGYALLASMPKPGRWLGVNAAVLTLSGGAIGACLPAGFAQWAFDAVPAILLASATLALVAVPWISGRAVCRDLKLQQPAGGDVGTRARWPLPAIAAFGGCILMFLGQGASWAYLFFIGTDAGLSADSVAFVLTAGLAASSLGGLGLAALSARYRVRTLASLGALGSSLSLLLLWWPPSLPIFAIAGLAYTFATGFLTPIAMLVIAHADPSGRYREYGGTAQLLGLAIGPVVGGWLLAFGGIQTMLLSAMLLMGSYGLITRPATRADPARP